MMRIGRIRRRIQHPFVCSFCHKDQEQVKRLVAGPGGVYICDECAVAFSEGGGERLEQRNARCSFCGKGREKAHFLVTNAQKVHVCNECLTLCLTIFEEEQLPG